MEIFNIEGSFPTVITPKKMHFEFKDLIQELPHHKEKIDALLLKQGALIFRGFNTQTSDEFSCFIETLKLGKFVNYTMGDSPRSKVHNKVYTSTEVPKNIHLHLHQELSYVKNFPTHIYFYCHIAPKNKGETIIGDARQIYQAINPDVVQRFREKALTYISHYFYTDTLMYLLNKIARSHKSWQEVFETNDKLEVEKICHNNEISYEWLHYNWIKLKQTRPADLLHPRTQEAVWFNQAHLFDFNPKLLGLFNYIGCKIIYSRPSTCLHEITFGDGTPIPRKDIYHIYNVLNEHTVAYPWKKGDIMVLDNVLTMHGRARFKGERRVLTALTA